MPCLVVDRDAAVGRIIVPSFAVGLGAVHEISLELIIAYLLLRTQKGIRV